MMKIQPKIPADTTAPDGQKFTAAYLDWMINNHAKKNREIDGEREANRMAIIRIDNSINQIEKQIQTLERKAAILRHSMPKLMMEFNKGADDVFKLQSMRRAHFHPNGKKRHWSQTAAL